MDSKNYLKIYLQGVFSSHLHKNEVLNHLKVFICVYFLFLKNKKV